jgi:hypothetical protein
VQLNDDLSQIFTKIVSASTARLVTIGGASTAAESWHSTSHGGGADNHGIFSIAAQLALKGIVAGRWRPNMRVSHPGESILTA